MKLNFNLGNSRLLGPAIVLVAALLPGCNRAYNEGTADGIVVKMELVLGTLYGLETIAAVRLDNQKTALFSGECAFSILENAEVKFYFDAPPASVSAKVEEVFGTSFDYWVTTLVSVSGKNSNGEHIVLASNIRCNAVESSHEP